MRFTRHLFFSLILLASLGFTACEKTAPSPESATKAQLVGRWQFVESSGGSTGKTIPADPAKKYEVVFTAAGQATGLLNGTVTGTAPYTLTVADAITGPNKIFLNCSGIQGLFAQGPIEISGNNFYLSDNFYDGFMSHYVRR
ncbi:hypothetical protein [Hymenobacter rubidus]|uniref:hypothetical protein n=1 Tax=Hymenobacter rubidus TaxID=1441626 RepID=UPI0019202DBA|nr:hypothetical protein [Hymenobacter rubidus]